MTTEAVRGGSGLEHGGGSSRGRVRQEDRDSASSESQKSHQSSCQVGTHRTRDLTRVSGEMLPGSRGQSTGNLGKGQDKTR